MPRRVPGAAPESWKSSKSVGAAPGGWRKRGAAPGTGEGTEGRDAAEPRAAAELRPLAESRTTVEPEVAGRNGADGGEAVVGAGEVKGEAEERAAGGPLDGPAGEIVDSAAGWSARACRGAPGGKKGRWSGFRPQPRPAKTHHADA